MTKDLECYLCGSPFVVTAHLCDDCRRVTSDREVAVKRFIASILKGGSDA